MIIGTGRVSSDAARYQQTGGAYTKRDSLTLKCSDKERWWENKDQDWKERWIKLLRVMINTARKLYVNSARVRSLGEKTETGETRRGRTEETHEHNQTLSENSQVGAHDSCEWDARSGEYHDVRYRTRIQRAHDMLDVADLFPANCSTTRSEALTHRARIKE